MPRATLVDYIGEQYGGDRMVLAAAGNLDSDDLLSRAETAFAGLSLAAAPPPVAGRYQGGDLRDERDLEQAHLVMGFDGVGFTDDDYYPLAVLSTALGGGMSSRLFQEVREERGLAYSIYSFLSCYEDGGIFGIYAGTGEEHLGDLIPLLADEAGKVIDTLNEEETERARAQLKASILMARESTSARTEQMARHLMLFGRPLDPEEIVAKIEAVDGNAVRQVAARIFRGRPSVAAIGPVKGLESPDSLAARFN